MTSPEDLAASPTAFGAFEYFPDNLEWSTQMVRLFSYCYVRGADFSEVHSVARSLPVGDNDAWQAGFAGLASKVEADAWRSVDGAHDVSARDAFLRASIYYRISGQMADIAGTVEIPPGLEDSIRTFREACARMSPTFTPVEVPYEGVTLPGYLAIPAGAIDGATPAVIDFGGIDAWAEEQYFKIGAALLERGYAVLILNGPGQGEAKMRGIYGRHDFEVVASATVDFMQTVPAVDADRIGLIGSSLGGYFAARAAAFEPRLKATVVWGAHNGWQTRPSAAEIAEVGRAASRIRQGKRFLGVEGLEALVEGLSKFRLGPEVLSSVSAPILIMHGESDVLVPVEDARTVFNDIGHDDKKLLIYPAGMPGSAHCQLDALAIAQQDMCDWLDDQLRR